MNSKKVNLNFIDKLIQIFLFWFLLFIYIFYFLDNDYKQIIKIVLKIENFAKEILTILNFIIFFQIFSISISLLSLLYYSSLFSLISSCNYIFFYFEESNQLIYVFQHDFFNFFQIISSIIHNIF